MHRLLSLFEEFSQETDSLSLSCRQRDRAERRAIAEASDKENEDKAGSDKVTKAASERDQRAKQEQLRRQGLQLTGKA